MGEIVLSQSVALVLSQVQMATEVWFGEEVNLIDSSLKCGPTILAPGKNGHITWRKKREVSVTARFRKKRRTEIITVSCSLTVKHVHTSKRLNNLEWWFVEENPVWLFIDMVEHLAKWEEPTASTLDLINVTVRNLRTKTGWTGLAHNERWPTKVGTQT